MEVSAVIALVVLAAMIAFRRQALRWLALVPLVWSLWLAISTWNPLKGMLVWMGLVSLIFFCFALAKGLCATPSNASQKSRSQAAMKTATGMQENTVSDPPSATSRHEGSA
ncbi:MAG: hypothetical protein KDI33_20315 [Halioglobus sp.]|nr:hypothetical protein [Halioglobus sp.]